MSEPATTGTRLLTAEEVAEQLQVPKSWIYREAREGNLPVVQLGRYRRFSAESVERWWRSRES